MHPSPADGRIRLTVVFLQYDRQKYALALERLVRLIAGLRSIDFKIVVVDNANPGLWQHEVSEGIVQVGGDNSAWEFSAFDRGMDFLAAKGASSDVYAFATDAFLAYGEDYLELIDEATLRYCLELRSPVGWIDSFMQNLDACGYSYRDWMRTSLFFLPGEILARVLPLTTPLAPEVIFGPTAETPFSESAPLSDNLQAHVLAWLTRGETDVALDEPWHSQFELTDGSFPFFKAKVAAILREHLLSARLQSLGIACYDFRLIRRLAEANVDVSKSSGIERRDWQWSAGREVEIEKQPRYHLDGYHAPRATVHGYPSKLQLAGWIATEPQIREVQVRLSGGHTIGGVCDVPRPDAVAGHPEYVNELCGFEISANLDGLEPGAYDVEWTAPGLELRESLGKIDVLPRSVFEARRCFLPESAFPGQDVPVAVEGVLECSYPLRNVSILWDGKDSGLAAEVLPLPRKSNGLYLYRIDVQGAIRFSSGALQHRLELEFQGENAMRYAWRRFQTIAVEETRPHALSVREIGELDPRSGSVPIRIRGAVLAGSMDDHLVLTWEGKDVYQERLSALASAQGSIAWFEIRRELAKIPAGTWDFSLSLKQQGSSPEVFARWRDRVKLTEPIIHVELMEARLPAKKPSHYFLGICGWVEYHDLVDRLLLKLDDKLVATLAINHFRPDVAAFLGATLIKKQGFHADVVLNTSPGDHVVQLVAVQETGNDVVWEGPLALDDLSTSGFLVRSADLIDLENNELCSYWSSIAVSGEVVSKLEGIVATLQVDGKIVDRQPVSGRFVLNHTPGAPGRHKVRVDFQHGGLELYTTGVVEVAFVKIRMPREIPVALERFIDRFKIREYLDLEKAEDLAHALVQLEQEGLPEFCDMLREIDNSLNAEKRGMALVSPARSDGGRRLNILFACWEVPSRRHGGGVWMTNLLKEFDGRHDVTLIHAYGPGEEGWVDDVRPYVNKIVSIPRMHQPALYRGDSRIPAAYYNDYTPALRAAIEAEVFAGDYDVVNHEYTKMFSHMSRADVPQVLIVHENIFTAQLNSLKDDPQPGSDPTIKLLALINNFYFLTGALPRACADVIGLTGEDTEILSDFQDRARVYVNTIGVDVDFPVPDKAPARFRRAHPTVMFLGNYHHPPNVKSALYFIKKVMPNLRKKYDELEFLAIGAYPSDEMKSFDSENGVTVTGRVDDFRPYLFAGNAFVAPIFTGAGMRVKILEAMACGIPIVGTRLSMNGIGAVEDEHYFRAENAAEFVEAVGRCLEHPAEARAVGLEGRKLIVERHSYGESARQREAIWYEAIERWQPARPSPQRGGLSLIRGVSDTPRSG